MAPRSSSASPSLSLDGQFHLRRLIPGDHKGSHEPASPAGSTTCAASKKTSSSAASSPRHGMPRLPRVYSRKTSPSPSSPTRRPPRADQRGRGSTLDGRLRRRAVGSIRIRMNMNGAARPSCLIGKLATVPEISRFFESSSRSITGSRPARTSRVVAPAPTSRSGSSDGSVSGHMQRRALALVLEWWHLHRRSYFEDWQLA